MRYLFKSFFVATLATDKVDVVMILTKPFKVVLAVAYPLFVSGFSNVRQMNQ